MDTLYKCEGVPDEYSYIYIDGDTYYFFDNELSTASNGYYSQRFVQGAYIVDYSIAEFDSVVLAKDYAFSRDIIYRCDFYKICYVFLFFCILLFVGVKIVTRFIYKGGI